MLPQVQLIFAPSHKALYQQLMLQQCSPHAPRARCDYADMQPTLIVSWSHAVAPTATTAKDHLSSQGSALSFGAGVGFEGSAFTAQISQSYGVFMTGGGTRAAAQALSVCSI